MIFNSTQNNVMIVAHPDDEILFGYSALVSGGKWTVICCTNRSNDIRSKEFYKLMNHIGVEPVMLDYKDEWGGEFPAELGEELSRLICNYDNIVTHNEMGEYGHSQHKSLNKIVSNITTKNLYCFGSAGDGSPLPFRILKDKVELLSMYDSQYALDAYDWSDGNSCMIKYVANESFMKHGGKK